MSILERTLFTHKDLGKEVVVPTPVRLPELHADIEELKRNGYQSAGVGIVILSESDLGEVQIALGEHKSTERTDQGLWSWFGETLQVALDGTIEPSDEAIVRCFGEELGIPSPEAINTLGLASDSRNLVTEVDLNTTSRKTGATTRYRVAMHTFWIPDSPTFPRENTSEIQQVDFFPLAKFLNGELSLPPREFTVPVLRDLARAGVLEKPTDRSRLAEIEVQSPPRGKIYTSDLRI